MAINFLPIEFKQHLNEKVSRENYQTREQWIVALKNEVDGVLLPMVKASTGIGSLLRDSSQATQPFSGAGP
jgi:hypothetical protein